MIVLADETLETFFDHEFANSFKLTEKATERQRSLGREIFDNLLATGSKLAAASTTLTSGRPSNQLKSKSPSSISTSELQATVDAIEETKLEEKAKEEADAEQQQQAEKKEEEEEQTKPEKIVTEQQPKADKHVIGDDSDEEDEEDEDLSPDVLEEVDRLLKEYGDEED